MSSHYYTPNPQGEHKYREITYDYAGKQLMLRSDANVFSKDRVDFGSSLLIQTMEIGAHDSVLDLGCGYGIVGICAALRAVHGEVLMVDINERAISLAEDNMRRNQITNGRALVSNAYENIPLQLKFDQILTNPPIRVGKKVVHHFFEEAYPRLNTGGSLWVVIQKKQGAESAEQKMRSIFGEVDVVAQKKGYRIIRGIR